MRATTARKAVLPDILAASDFINFWQLHEKQGCYLVFTEPLAIAIAPIFQIKRYPNILKTFVSI